MTTHSVSLYKQQASTTREFLDVGGGCTSRLLRGSGVRQEYQEELRGSGAERGLEPFEIKVSSFASTSLCLQPVEEPKHSLPIKQPNRGKDHKGIGHTDRDCVSTPATANSTTAKKAGRSASRDTADEKPVLAVGNGILQVLPHPPTPQPPFHYRFSWESVTPRLTMTTTRPHVLSKAGLDRPRFV